MNIIKSKNGTYYVSKKEGYEAIANAKIKSHHNAYYYIVLEDRYYVLEYNSQYFKIIVNEPFISIELYHKFTNEYEETLKDLKENKDFYEKSEIEFIKGKLHYIGELINKSRHQLRKLHLL